MLDDHTWEDREITAWSRRNPNELLSSKRLTSRNDGNGTSTEREEPERDHPAPQERAIAKTREESFGSGTRSGMQAERWAMVASLLDRAADMFAWVIRRHSKVS